VDKREGKSRGVLELEKDKGDDGGLRLRVLSAV
jgi:hypothetical protein